MFHMVDTSFSYGRVLIVCQFLQESSKVKESSLHKIRSVDTAFLRSGAPFGTSFHSFNHTCCFQSLYLTVNVIFFQPQNTKLECVLYKSDDGQDDTSFAKFKTYKVKVSECVKLQPGVLICIIKTPSKGISILTIIKRGYGCGIVQFYQKCQMSFFSFLFLFSFFVFSYITSLILSLSLSVFLPLFHFIFISFFSFFLFFFPVYLWLLKVHFMIITSSVDKISLQNQISLYPTVAYRPLCFIL